jgi:hypothetical protein
VMSSLTIIWLPSWRNEILRVARVVVVVGDLLRIRRRDQSASAREFITIVRHAAHVGPRRVANLAPAVGLEHDSLAIEGDGRRRSTGGGTMTVRLHGNEENAAYRTSLRWSSSHVTVNDLGLFAFPLGVTTTTGPVVAPAGTVAVIVW